MTRIESLSARADRGSRYLLRLSDGSTLRLYRQTIEDFGLYAGLELTEEELAKIRESAGATSAKMRAVRIVSASNVSRKDLEQRLIQKGERPDQAKDAVQWMTELDLVDDAKTAAQIVSRCIAKGYGLQRARQALYEKRIPKEFWEDALADYPDQTDSILHFLQDRLGDSWDPRDLKRAVDALLRRGHNYSDIQRCLRMLDAEDFREET